MMCMFSVQIFICVLSISIFSGSNTFGKLILERDPANTKKVHKIMKCLLTTIYRYYKGGPVVFLSNELQDSLGELLIKFITNATVEIRVEHKYKKRREMFFLQPKSNVYDFPIYRHLIKKADKASFFLVLWRPNTSLSAISELHEIFWLGRILRVGSFIPTNIGNLIVYTYFPYSKKYCGIGRVVTRVDKCTFNGFQTDFNLSSWLIKLQNFHGCNIKCFGSNQFPESELIPGPNGTWDVEGNIVNVLETLKSHYNLSLTYSNIFNDQYGWFYYNTSMQSLIKKYENKSYEFGFGQFTILNAIYNPKIEYSFASNPECIGWAIPEYAGKKRSLLRIYLIEFALVIWSLIGLSIIIAVKIVVIASHLEGNHITLTRVVQIVTIIAFSIISESPKNKSKLLSIKAFLFLWSIWGFIVRCAYEASLGSFMTVPIYNENIKSHEELLNSNMRVAGGIKMYQLLKEGASSKALKVLLQRFEILPPTPYDQIVREIEETRNLAVLQPNHHGPFISGKYVKKEGRFALATVMRPCFIQTFASPLMTRKGFVMSKLLNNFITRMLEAGFIKHWKLKDSYVKRKQAIVHIAIPLIKLRGVFLIYLIGIGVASFVFLVELFYFKLVKKWKVNGMKRNLPFAN